MASREELENVMPQTSLEWTEEAKSTMKKVPFFVRKAAVRSIEEFARDKGFAVVDADVVARARQEKEGGARGAAAPVAAGGPPATVTAEATNGNSMAARADAPDTEEDGDPRAKARVGRQFVNFSFFKVDSAWRRLPEAERERGKKEFLAVVEEYDQPGKLIIVSYSLVGIRSDAELMLWRIGDSPELFNEMTARLLKTGLGQYLTISYSYLAMTKRSQYKDRISPEHEDDRTRIVPGKAKYLFIYPFVKKREWYMLTEFTRQGMMDEHIYIGNKFPSVKLNTTYSFGIDDYEFVVAFETDYPADFLDLVQELRFAQASMYTLQDTPIFTCIGMDLTEAVDRMA